MISITIQCTCGQDFVFDVEPIDGQMPSTVACPTCGLDATERGNEEIQRQFTSVAPLPAAPAHKSDTMMVIGACVGALALLAMAGGAFLWWKSRSETTVAPVVESSAAKPETLTTAPAPSAPQPEPVSSTPEPQPAVSTPEPSAPVAEPAPTASVGSKGQRDPSRVAIGALFDPDLIGGQVKITRVINNSPAKKAGIMAGDVLISIDNTPLKGLPSKEVADLLFGPVGSKITVELVSFESGQTKKVKMTRKKYR
ncbi:MAG: peptidase [Verrucomicrobiales bacterium]|nr:peptidase [Verrucomicrobiales bacterium]